ncbi:Glycerol-3-phosphate acyltransferase [Candidatus Profftia tarda]|uniref:Glycerol-3-phosphate acyltransferase n=1 Tax=Candidatus Profftia tarda TaxID=1177216 RepID=A0A8E4H4F6_9ENTR|nr:Glycerol-3-phosphate acyltransferase [Candidatus Profftia tarda]
MRIANTSLLFFILCWRRFFLNLLKFKIKILVRSTIIPSQPVSQLCLDMTRPVVYILPCNSKLDLLTLRHCCLIHNLPDPLDTNQINGTILPRYVFLDDLRGCHNATIQKSVKLFQYYIEIHRHNPFLDIQIIPTSVMFGRSPHLHASNSCPRLHFFNFVKKCFVVIWLGRDSFVHFSSSVSLRHISDKYGSDHVIAHKMVRLARMHFFRQRLSAVGPIPLEPRDLFIKMLSSKAIRKAVEGESRSKKISLEKAEQKAVVLMKEIAANFTYATVRLSNRVLAWLWNRLYQSINVHHVESVLNLAQAGHEIVYVPCHRSHMDYLLISYVLYQQGLVPPHIAAGINLNFWPVGSILRRLGAFFIRRTFKGNKLYSTIFREYLSELFSRGYSIEYFMEGGRSRTGRLLEPKTGTLAITIQSILRGSRRPVTLVPVYIGYEHIMEVVTYAKELGGAIKENENIIQMFRGLTKLRNLGEVHVNFGEPININNWLNQHVPEWRESINAVEPQRPRWFTPTVNAIAHTIMVNINKSAAANAINLCSTAVLAASPHALTREQLLEQLVCYLDLLNNTPYAARVTTPNQNPEDLLKHAIHMGKFAVKKNNIGHLIILPQEQALLLAYYRNNIQHMLVLPSLISNIVMHYNSISFKSLLRYLEMLYPLFEKDLFLCHQIIDLPELLKSIVIELSRQKLLFINGNDLMINHDRIFVVTLLAAVVRETLQRYAITFSLLISNPKISRSELEKKSWIMAQHLSISRGIHSLEFLDKSLLSTLIATLNSKGYMYNVGESCPKHTVELYHLLVVMLD